MTVKDSFFTACLVCLLATNVFVYRNENRRIREQERQISDLSKQIKSLNTMATYYQTGRDNCMDAVQKMVRLTKGMYLRSQALR